MRKATCKDLFITLNRVQKRPPISYSSIVETQNFSMGIFYLKEGYQIPLHDHPGMTVFSKVMHGRVHVRSFTWKEKDVSNKPSTFITTEKDGMLLREAVVIGDYVINSSDENCLLKISPFSANLHAITAISDCCFLDILGPPYKVGERDCHYYEEIELVSGGQPDDKTSVYLAELEENGYYCACVPYSGPKIGITDDIRLFS
ncbi:2-aminoethanethiol dioxygenase-like isoform X2 [Zophobas morio]|jgi:hypothetical protein